LCTSLIKPLNIHNGGGKKLAGGIQARKGGGRRGGGGKGRSEINSVTFSFFRSGPGADFRGVGSKDTYDVRYIEDNAKIPVSEELTCTGLCGKYVLLCKYDAHERQFLGAGTSADSGTYIELNY
jgi:hypothetical protein